MEDRSSLPGMRPEHGLSLLLEIDGKKWLFDTGQTNLVVDNARSLGIDLGEIEGIILSHGHYDHTGGLEAVLAETGEVDIFAHPGIFRDRFRLEKSGKTTPIGIPFSRSILEKMGGRFNLKTSGREISPGIYLSGEIPRVTSFEKGDRFLLVREGDKYIPDPFSDDQFILLDDAEDVIMITGCCHAGLINSLLEVRRLHPGKKIKAIVGGLHLRAADQTLLAKVARSLVPFLPAEIIAGHCTGERAEAVLSHLPDGSFHRMTGGSIFEL